MKVILTTLNSKFIHSNLAIRYLASYINDICPIDVVEFTINQNLDYISSEIFKLKPDILGFSTYIWNLEETLRVCEIIKLVSPGTKILLGGPEVSFESEELMDKHQFIDFIIYGEGEETFKEFIQSQLYNEKALKDVVGLVYRDDKIITNKPRALLKDLNTIPSPYRSVGDDFRNKIVYYESSRGCPFNCEFCLSSTIQGVRYFPIDRVKGDILSLIEGGVSQVKFVDRTFNANKTYAMEIMRFIMEQDPKDINFHFEVTAHLIDEEMLLFLKQPKEGLFQFEIGVQSTNEETIDAIGRITDFEKLKKISKIIKSYKNIHQHLDLIAGLPYEGYGSFGNSFNDVYSIRPEKIQLGFLKLLKGSGLKRNKDLYCYKYIDKPPYEVLENNYISFSEIVSLRNIEGLVDKFYNEGYFENALEFLINNFYEKPFNLYEDFAAYWEENNLYDVSHSRNGLYQIILEFYIDSNFQYVDLFKELLKFDYIKNNKKNALPQGLDRVEFNLEQSKIHDLLKSESIIEDYLYEYKDITTKKLIKKVIIEGFSFDLYKVINDKYKPIENLSENYILFSYKDGQIIKCKTFDITKNVGELI